jgi:Mrp family chromosome partitioning ATPase
MSKNFELLQQIGKEEDIFQMSTSPLAPEPETFEAEAPTTSHPAYFGESGLEEVKAMVQRTFLLPGIETPRTVIFTSTESGSGCTWVCARVAEALASQVSGSVCLVDANLYAPGLHEQFGIPNHYGLSEALLQPEPMINFVTQLSRPNLKIVSCGSALQKAQGLLASDRMRGRINELRSNFSFVLLDTSALSLSKEAFVLGKAADGVVLLLKANASRKETARSAVQEFQAARIKVLGAVLNQRKFPIPEALYKRL